MIPKPAFQGHSPLTFLPAPSLLVSKLLINKCIYQTATLSSLTNLTNQQALPAKNMDFTFKDLLVSEVSESTYLPVTLCGSL